MTEQQDTKQKKKSKLLLWLILVVALLGMAVSGFMLLWELVILPYQNRGAMESLQNLAVQEEDQSSRYDFAALQKENPEIIGWISVPNTVIDYPVLQSSKDDPEKYLYRNYKGENTKYGSVFLDANTTVNSRSMTLYGHHMADGQMFADVLKFGDMDFVRQTPQFIFDTPAQRGDYVVVGLLRTNAKESQGKVFSYIRSNFASDQSFLDFVQQLQNRSIYKTNVQLNEADQLLLLSTCSEELPDFRTVLIARKLRTGETVADYQAETKESPLYPEGWYTRYGGVRPQYPETFAEAQQQGLTDWYDGAITADTES